MKEDIQKGVVDKLKNQLEIANEQLAYYKDKNKKKHDIIIELNKKITKIKGLRNPVDVALCRKITELTKSVDDWEIAYKTIRDEYQTLI